MASIHKRPDSKFWHGAWRAADGRLVLRSTKQTDRKKAMMFAQECERAEKLAGADAITEATAREILNDILKRTSSGDALRCPTIRGYLDEWMTAKKAVKAEGTSARYGKSVREFLTYLADRADKPLSTLSPSHVQGFVNERSKAGLAAATVTLDAKVIRTALNRARRTGLVTVNAAEAVDFPESDAVERAAFTSAEVKMLLDASDGEWKTLILLAYFTGGRLSDLTKMEWQNADLTKGVLTYTQGKTGGTVTVPIHPDLDTQLNKLASSDKPEKFIMPGMADKGPGGRHGLSETFKNIMRKAGIDDQRVERKTGVRTLARKSFHALRHSFASALANAGVAPELRMKLTGHATESAHKGYSHLEMATLRAAIGKLPTL